MRKIKRANLIFALLLSASGMNNNAAAQRPVPENIFLVSMDSMMAAMEKAPKGKTIEQEFLQQMIPHHRGAIVMAEIELKDGKDFKMRQLAKSIIAEQKIEMQQMALWLKTGSSKNTQLTAINKKAMGQSMQVMMANLPSSAQLKDTDHAFALVMAPHHEAAVAMAKTLIKYSHSPQDLSFAKQLISDEQIEIEQMSSFK
jgi:uncharacterized protein (DUF305 family)